MWIVFARFICGIVLHVSLSAELRQGMNLMKYAVNHPWKFEDYRVAFFSGFMQTNVVIIVELVNFIALITNETVLDIVMNFLALVVIADFDDFFFSATESEFADVISDPKYDQFLIIQTTTSWNARDCWEKNRLTKQECEKNEEVFCDIMDPEAKERKEKDRKQRRDERDRKRFQQELAGEIPDAADDDEEVLSEQEEAKETKLISIPTHIYINFWDDRTFFNKILYCYYKMLRWLFVAFWYYFFPFIALMASYIVPKIFQLNPNLDDQIQDAVEVDVVGDEGATTLLLYQ